MGCDHHDSFFDTLQDPFCSPSELFQEIDTRLQLLSSKERSILSLSGENESVGYQQKNFVDMYRLPTRTSRQKTNNQADRSNR